MRQKVFYKRNLVTIIKRETGNSCYCKHKRVQNQTKYNLEGYKKCLKISEFKIEVNYFLTCNKHEISMLKQKSSFAYI